MLTREDCNIVNHTALYFDSKTQMFVADASDIERYFVEDPTSAGIYIEGRREAVKFDYTGATRDAEGELLFDTYTSPEGFTLRVYND